MVGAFDDAGMSASTKGDDPRRNAEGAERGDGSGDLGSGAEEREQCALAALGSRPGRVADELEHH